MVPPPFKRGAPNDSPSDPAPGSNHLAQACSFPTLTGQKPEFVPLLDLQFPWELTSLIQSLCPTDSLHLARSNRPVTACWPHRNWTWNVRHAVCLCRKCRALGKVRRSKVHWGPEFISLKGKGLWNVALEKEGEVVNLDPVDHYIFTSRSTITWKSVHLTKNTLVSENTIVWLLNWLFS